jgi:hypothetical protein
MKLIRPYLLTECAVLEQNLIKFRKTHRTCDVEAINTALTHLGDFRDAVRDNDLHLATELAHQAFLSLRNAKSGTVQTLNASTRLFETTALEVRRIDRRQASATKRAGVSRRTKWAIGLAVRLLPPADRARYRQEFAAELADLPRCDQTPYAFRLVCRAGSLRRSLMRRPSVRSTRIVVVVGSGVCGFTALAASGWPAAFLGSVLIIAGAWTVSSQDRTRRLANLIRAARKR